MVKRFPHTITIESPSFKEVDGQLQKQDTVKATIKGRFEPLSIPKVVLKEGGDSVEVSLCVFTKVKPISDAVSVTFDGQKYNVVKWEAWQTYSIIYLK
ncbi:hypothetical protein KDU71_07450 [Carboxylicivirga sediminis]|uniref:Uncharacterized protein n=1 Tax=Carboxylicivirga sediminis TaxID=2006564 RepID=A0A941F281_9BACT|nr:hypothetical protein [Carboxylicivirga sediminis]MBR8535391.1 hypothetical protein [Carboxylicivirga sediminis]